MFKTIKAVAYVTACVPSYTVEYARYRKERAARIRGYRAHDAMIAESQAKIGPYIPTPCPTQIWA